MPGTATITLERGDITLVVESVVARICPNCGEEYMDQAAAGRLFSLAEQAVQAGA